MKELVINKKYAISVCKNISFRLLSKEIYKWLILFSVSSKIKALIAWLSYIHRFFFHRKSFSYIQHASIYYTLFLKADRFN